MATAGSGWIGRFQSSRTASLGHTAERGSALPVMKSFSMNGAPPLSDRVAAPSDDEATDAFMDADR